MAILKRVFFITLAKTTRKLAKLLNRGAGTALPGLILEKYYPSIFEHYAKQLEQVIIITGTNGKTTTKALIHEILKESNIQHITNESGSNLKRGLIATFTNYSNLNGKLSAKTALLEVEEATLPKITHILKPTVIIVTNLFRDQLDAYGEVNKTKEYIRKAIEASPQAKIILNSDDPLVSSLTDKLKNKTVYFSLPTNYRKYFKYEAGTATKPNSKDLTYIPRDITINQDLTFSFTLNLIKYQVNTPGIFHVYNALAALVTAKTLSIAQKHIQSGFNNFQPAFGRGEILDIKFDSLPDNLKKHYSQPLNIRIFLIKNPAGFNLTLETLSTLENIKLLILINDKIADGRDVSWLWDSELEKLKGINPKTIVTSGTRAKDMGLRLKYALNMDQDRIQIEENIENAVTKLLQIADRHETVYVLPTYTAMNEFRALLGKRF